MNLLSLEHYIRNLTTNTISITAMKIQLLYILYLDCTSILLGANDRMIKNTSK